MERKVIKERLFKIIFGKKRECGLRYRLYYFLIKRDSIKTLWDISLRRENGLDRDKKFVVFARKDYGFGICSDIIHFLLLIARWEKKDRERIPVIDMMNYESMYLENEKLGLENAWEYFFEQISEYSLEDAYNSGDVILAGCRYPEMYEGLRSMEKVLDGSLRENKRELEYWGKLYNKHFKLSKAMKEEIESNYRKLMENIQKKNKILGVKFRLTDYAYALATGHYIQPSIEEMIVKTKKTMKMGGYGYVYLTVEDKTAVEEFKKEFGEKLIHFDCPLAEYDNGQSGVSIAKMASIQLGKKRSGVDYLIGIMLLARCDALLASSNSGTIVAVIANGGKYENIYFIDHGKKR